MEIENLPSTLGHLSNQFERANPILLTGAGFSLAAKNIAGESLPGAYLVRKRLWELCFGEEPFDETSSLQDLYQTARTRHSNKTVEWLTASLTVMPESLPDWYQVFYSFPWHRCYTLNIDDLGDAIQRRFNLRRELVSTSATSSAVYGQVRRVPAEALDLIHLNGKLNDLPDNVTFSLSQFAERLSREEPWYEQLIVELLSRPVVFVGTSLDEPPLWQHIERRKSRGGKTEQQLRPKSYLVTPNLSKARQACLSEFNISWIPLTAEDFCNQVLIPIKGAAHLGQKYLQELSSQKSTKLVELPLVSDLSTTPPGESSFLLGAEPTWDDIQSNRAVERECDRAIIGRSNEALASDKPRGLIIVSGTAGTGKSTSLKRVALALSAAGRKVAWIDKTIDASPYCIRNCMTKEKAPSVLAIDDADIYGAELSPIIKEVCLSLNHPLILVGVRSGKLDRALNPTQLEHVPQAEFSIPLLTDTDIDGLLDVLDRENRLGALVNKSYAERRKDLQNKCGRQLLVAMIEATSGEPFQKKIASELDQLESEAQRLYAVICVVSSWRFHITKNELLLAVGEVNNKVLNAIQRLTNRHLITCRDENYSARHRVIAELVLEQLIQSGRLTPVLYGLASSAATQITAGMPSHARPRRLLQRILSHDFLLKTIFEDAARNLYAQLEDLLRSECNYWLHRGCLELESGNLPFAEVCLNYARGLNSEDLNIQNEYAHLLFRKALTRPSSDEAPGLVEEATKLLMYNISVRGNRDPHSYHVLGDKMLQWINTGIAPKEQKARELERVMRIVDEGRNKHPLNDHLQILQSKLKDEYLSLAVTIKK